MKRLIFRVVMGSASLHPRRCCSNSHPSISALHINCLAIDRQGHLRLFGPLGSQARVGRHPGDQALGIYADRLRRVPGDGVHHNTGCDIVADQRAADVDLDRQRTARIVVLRRLNVAVDHQRQAVERPDRMRLFSSDDHRFHNGRVGHGFQDADGQTGTIQSPIDVRCGVGYWHSEISCPRGLAA